ncbi:MAG: glutamate--tRNA ligase [Clostridia bacterium]|nr:glutamate--tRNA ligase [Clostridia bacterium]
MSVRVRFAPSPTGYVHIGGLRTALYNYLFAKKNGGTYLLRVEDTDQTRYVEGAVEGMIEVMEWAGVPHSEGPVLRDGKIVELGDCGPYIQSQRTEIYREHVEQLLASGHAYYCFCSKERLDNLREAQKEEGKTPRYDGHCRDISYEEAKKRVAAGEPHVVRLKMPENRDIVFTDMIRGTVTVNTAEIDDQVLIKTDGFPTYHLAVIVDDHYMGITHVVRGEEWLISTPKHVYTYEAFGWDAPTFVHLPVILNKDKKKLSKRQGDVAVEDFKKKGYLAEALINYVALVGWSPEDNQEIFSMDELIEKFSFERVSKSGGVFDLDKLNWVNNHYIKEAALDRIVEGCKPYMIEAGLMTAEELEVKSDWFAQIVDLMRERFNRLMDVTDHMALFMEEDVTLENDEAREMVEMEHVPEMLTVFASKIEAMDEVTPDALKDALKEVQKETGNKGKNLFMPTRVAITGQLHGPDLNKMMSILGKETVLKRLATYTAK